MGKTRTPELPVGDPAHVAPKGLGHSVDRVTCRWQPRVSRGTCEAATAGVHFKIICQLSVDG